MRYRPLRSVGSGGLFLLVFLAVGPGLVSAHDITGSRIAAPLPLSVLFVGAAATVAATALWLAVGDETGIPHRDPRRSLRLPASIAGPVRYGLAGLFFAGVVAALVLGVVGRQVATDNFATVFTWPVWFRGLALVAIVVGTPWRTLSPWRTVYRGLIRLEGRPIAVLGSLPTVLGAWPAVAGFVALIGIVETLTVIPRSPGMTTVVIGTYALAMIGGAVLFGADWLRRGDPLGVLYRLFGRVSSIAVARREDGAYTVAVRPPWQGCLDPVGGTSLVVFVVAMVYTVSFDGFTNTLAYQRLLFGLRDVLGTGPESSLLLYGLGLVAFVLTFVVTIWLVERLGAGSGRQWVSALRWFAPTVIPIAAAYEVAHNYPYVLGSLGRVVGIVLGAVVPGVGPIDPLAWLSVPLFWGSQVALIVLGHVVGVVAAHGVAVDRYDTLAAARQGHGPLVVLMVGYSVLSLWIVSQPLVA